MNLLGAILYDPSSAVTKNTTALSAMAAFDTTNLRLSVTVPAHGMVRFRMRVKVGGSATSPIVLLGVMVGSTVVGRVWPTNSNQNGECYDADFTVTGLTPGATNFDAAFSVQTASASTSMKYGGPNDTSGTASGGFVFEAYDPRPLALALDGAVNVGQWLGTAVTAATAGTPDVNTKRINNVLAATPGAAGGVLISGSNSGTTTLGALTVTGALGLGSMSITGTSTFTGNVTFSGTTTYTGNVGYSDGITVSSPSTTNRSGVTISGNGSGHGFVASGGSTGDGGRFLGGATSGNGITAKGLGQGNGLDLLGGGTAAHGLLSTGAPLGTSDGIKAVAGAAGGVPRRGDMTGNITGNLSGSVGSVTGLTASNLDVAVSSRMATYTQPTGFLAATFPATVASTTNITAGTITTVTNLTNAPTAGDFTATMKTSIGTAVAASAVASVTGNVGGNVVGSVGSVTARVTANTDQLAGQTVTAAAGVTFPTSIASPTNITGGTITTVTNLTNAPTAGDFTATMKTSIGTAVAASAVASVTGNVGGNVTGSVGSIATGGIAAASFAAGAINAAAIATDAIDADSIKADAVTKIQAGLSTYAGGDTSGTTTLLSRLTATRSGYLDNLSGGAVALASGVLLSATQSLYAPAKAGDAMTLTVGAAEDVATRTEAHLLDEGDSQPMINAIVTAIGNSNVDETALVAAIRADMERTGGKLQLIDAKTTNLPASPAAVGSAMTLAADAVNASALANSAVAEIQSGLSTLTAAEVKTQADAALADYDGPTKAELDAGLAALETHGDLEWSTGSGGATATEIADAVLTRDWTSVTGEAAYSVLNALRFVRNGFYLDTTTLHVRKEDGSDAYTRTVTFDPAAAPVTGVG